MATDSPGVTDSIEYRKVQITGGSTFTVSLPKEWAKRHGIQNGDRLSLQRREDGSLTLLPSSVAGVETPPSQVDATKLEGTFLLRTLLGQYLAGQDAILVRARPRLSLAQREVIRRFTRICVGPEIVEETGESVLVRDLVNPAEFTLRNALNRIHLMTQSMIQDSLVALTNHDSDAAKDVQSRDDEVDRLHRLVSKRFAKMLTGGAGTRDPSVTLLEAQRIYQVSRLLERCADHASNVALMSQQVQTKPLKKEDQERLTQLGDRSADLLRRAFTAFRKGDVIDANKIVDDSHKLAAEKPKVREALIVYGAQYSSSLSLLLESLERIHQYAADIAEVTLNTLDTATTSKDGLPLSGERKLKRPGAGSPALLAVED